MYNCVSHVVGRASLFTEDPPDDKKGGSMSLTDDFEKRILECYRPATESDKPEEIEFLSSVDIAQQLDSVFYLTKDDVSEVLYKNEFKLIYVVDCYMWKVVRLIH